MCMCMHWIYVSPYISHGHFPTCLCMSTECWPVLSVSCTEQLGKALGTIGDRRKKWVCFLLPEDIMGCNTPEN